MKSSFHRLLREGVGAPTRDGRPLRWTASAVADGAGVLGGARGGFLRAAAGLLHPRPGERARSLGWVESVALQRGPDGALEAWGKLRLDRVPRGLRRALAAGKVGPSLHCRAWTSPATDGGPDLAHGLAPEDGTIIVDIVTNPALAGRSAS